MVTLNNSTERSSQRYMPWLFKYYVAEAYAPYIRPMLGLDSSSSKYCPCLPENQPKQWYFGSSIDDILADKAQAVRMKMEGLLAQIERRRGLSKETKHAIDSDICSCEGKLMQLEHIPLTYGGDAQKVRSSFYQQVLSLEQERRREELNYWRDLVELRNDFIDAVAEYREASVRSEFCAGDSRGS